MDLYLSRHPAHLPVFVFQNYWHQPLRSMELPDQLLFHPFTLTNLGSTLRYRTFISQTNQHILSNAQQNAHVDSIFFDIIPVKYHTTKVIFQVSSGCGLILQMYLSNHVSLSIICQQVLHLFHPLFSHIYSPVGELVS